MDPETHSAAERYRVLEELIFHFSLGSCRRALIQFAFEIIGLALDGGLITGISRSSG